MHTGSAAFNNDRIPSFVWRFAFSMPLTWVSRTRDSWLRPKASQALENLDPGSTLNSPVVESETSSSGRGPAASQVATKCGSTLYDSFLFFMPWK